MAFINFPFSPSFFFFFFSFLDPMTCVTQNNLIRNSERIIKNLRAVKLEEYKLRIPVLYYMKHYYVLSVAALGPWVWAAYQEVL